MLRFLTGGEIGIRTLGTREGTPVFKTGALNQLDHLSVTYLAIITTIYITCQHIFYIFLRIKHLIYQKASNNECLLSIFLIYYM